MAGPTPGHLLLRQLTSPSWGGMAQPFTLARLDRGSPFALAKEKARQRERRVTGLDGDRLPLRLS